MEAQGASVVTFHNQCASAVAPTPASAISRTLSCAADSMHSVTIAVTRSCSERSMSTTSSSCTCRITRERMRFGGETPVNVDHGDLHQCRPQNPESGRSRRCARQGRERWRCATRCRW